MSGFRHWVVLEELGLKDPSQVPETSPKGLGFGLGLEG